MVTRSQQEHLLAAEIDESNSENSHEFAVRTLRNFAGSSCTVVTPSTRFVPRFRAFSASSDYGFKESLFHDMEGNNGRHCTCVKSCHDGSMVGDVKMEEACQVEARKVEWQASRSFLS